MSALVAGSRNARSPVGAHSATSSAALGVVSSGTGSSPGSVWPWTLRDERENTTWFPKRSSRRRGGDAVPTAPAVDERSVEESPSSAIVQSSPSRSSSASQPRHLVGPVERYVARGPAADGEPGRGRRELTSRWRRRPSRKSRNGMPRRSGLEPVLELRGHGRAAGVVGEPAIGRRTVSLRATPARAVASRTARASRPRRSRCTRSSITRAMQASPATALGEGIVSSTRATKVPLSATEKVSIPSSSSGADQDRAAVRAAAVRRSRCSPPRWWRAGCRSGRPPGSPWQRRRGRRTGAPREQRAARQVARFLVSGERSCPPSSAAGELHSIGQGLFRVPPRAELRSTPGRRSAGDRAGQQLHRVEHRQRAAEPLGVRRDLQRAARVSGRHGLGARVEQVARLALAQLGRGLGLDQVVDPRRAAAELPLGAARPAPGRGCRAAARAAARARPARGPGGRRRGRRPSSRPGGARRAGRPRPGTRTRRARARRTRAARSAQSGSSRSTWP